MWKKIGKAVNILNKLYWSIWPPAQPNPYHSVVDPWEGPGGDLLPPPLLFRPNWGSKGWKKFFGRPPPPSPLISRSGSGTAQCVTISLCRHLTLLSQTFVHVFRQECRVITQRTDTYLMQPAIRRSFFSGKRESRWTAYRLVSNWCAVTSAKCYGKMKQKL